MPTLQVEPSGDATRVFRGLRALTKDEQILPILRVSSGTQHKTHNRRGQVFASFAACEESNVSMTVPYYYVGSGADLSWLTAAVRTAKERGITTLLTPSVNRIIRHPKFHPVTNPHLQATESQLDHLLEISEGMTWISVCSPAATASEEKRFEIKNGIFVSDRENLRELAVLLKGKMRWSHSQIAEHLQIPVGTIRWWWREWICACAI